MSSVTFTRGTRCRWVALFPDLWSCFINLRPCLWRQSSQDPEGQFCSGNRHIWDCFCILQLIKMLSDNKKVWAPSLLVLIENKSQKRLSGSVTNILNFHRCSNHLNKSRLIDLLRACVTDDDDDLESDKKKYVKKNGGISETSKVTLTLLSGEPKFNLELNSSS